MIESDYLTCLRALFACVGRNFETAATGSKARGPKVFTTGNLREAAK